MNIEYLKTSDLIPYSKNAKRHPAEQVKLIANSIKEFGFQQPIVIDKDNIVVIGHGRLLAAKRLKIDTVPIVRVDNLTDDQDSGEIEEDEAPEEVESRVKLGDVWQLGTHRLICGDSTDVAVIDKLMGEESANLVLTDPPYGINAVNKDGNLMGDTYYHKVDRGVYEPIVADDTTETAQAAYDLLQSMCDKLILWGGNYFLDFLPPSDGWLIWDKRGDSGIRNNFADGEMAYCSFHTPVRIYHQLWNGMIREGEHEKRVHPTQKPIKMLSEIIQDFSAEGDLILDVFGGSGSTLIACEHTGRRCFMCELSERYCDIIISRWEQLTGLEAERVIEGDEREELPF